MNRSFCIVAIAVLLTTTICRLGSAEDTIDYGRDVYPVLEKYCVACHTADEAQGSLVMTSYDLLMRGGESGPAITAGVPTSSRLFLMASGKREPIMPPDDAEGPSDAELQMIATWIEQGAKGPEGNFAMRRELLTPDVKANREAELPITAIAASPDGVNRAIARYGEVRVVAGDANLPITVLETQPGKVNSLRFTRDGKTLLVASGVTGLYGRAATYEVGSGKLLVSIEGHTDAIQTAIFSPDENSIATASYDRDILLWDAKTGKLKQRFTGHNGAVYSLAFSPVGRTLISGCADETVKVWDVDSGQRLDTMGQPTGEVFSVVVTADGKYVIAGSSDNRLRVWQLLSRDAPGINPLIATRFVDESPLTHLALTNDGTRLVVVSEAGNVKVLRTSDWNQVAVLETLGQTASDLTISPDGKFAIVSLMNGEIASRELPAIDDTNRSAIPRSESVQPTFIDTGEPQNLSEDAARKDQGLAASTSADHPVMLPRGADIKGSIAAAGEEDWYAFDARIGEMWVIETNTVGMESKLDSVIEIRDRAVQPVMQARLQAVRDSYFTFRGKNSTQNDDFRVFAWEEMKLDEYLYANGEIVKLWLAPRGADSGFNVYPGLGNRWTYFGSSGTVHALGEPAYIVRLLEENETPAANGLPVFERPYVNDDASSQDRGKDSVLIFKSPQTGRFLVRLRDSRSEGGEAFYYRLRVRPAAPGFKPTVDPITAPIRRGSGRELKVNIDRIDGYDGEVWFDIAALPKGIHSNFPVRIQPGQSFAIGNIWADLDAPSWDGEVSPMVTAHASIGGKMIERQAGIAGKLKVSERPSAILSVVADNLSIPNGDVVRIKRGETISLLVKADRQEGFTKEISLGKEQAGRNMPHGVYVDNIGLNGLLVREGESERQFFVTADPIAELGKRDCFLTGGIDGNITSLPIQLVVVP